MGFYSALKSYSHLGPYTLIPPSILYPGLPKSPCPTPDSRHFLLVSVFSVPNTSAQVPLYLPPDWYPSLPLSNASCHQWETGSLKTNAHIMTLPASQTMVPTADQKTLQAQHETTPVRLQPHCGITFPASKSLPSTTYTRGGPETPRMYL